VATHRGDQVLDKLLETLRAAQGPCGTNFIRGRRVPLKKGELPYGMLRFRDERITRHGANAFLDRVLAASVNFYLLSTPADPITPEIETQMFEIRLAYENAIQAQCVAGTWFGDALVRDCEIVRFGEPRIEVRDEDYGQLQMDVVLQYRTRFDDASAI
jgi:hypothetical protein